MTWFTGSLVFLLFCLPPSIANQICPVNLSKNCKCNSSQSGLTISCNYGNAMADNLLHEKSSDSHQVSFYRLNISGNNLKNLPLDYFDGIESISHIDMSKNLFQEIPSVVYNIKHLLELDVSYCQINTFNLQGLDTSLRKLNLAGNKIAYLEPETFESFNHMKILDLSNNINLKSIDDMKFPNHLLSLDLSKCNLQQINDCDFRNLFDLEFLNLNGNEIPCSCHVTWLYQWVSENQKGDPFHEIKIVPWECIQNGNETLSVDNIMLCENHSPEPNHCNIDSRVAMETNDLLKLDLQVEVEEDTVMMSWKPTNISVFSGYRVVITDMENRENIKSIMLHTSSEEYVTKYDGFKSGEFLVCLQVVSDKNETSAIYEECEELTNSSLQIVIGILAGTIFLIPCIIALIYIIRKDILYHRSGYTKTNIQEKEAEKVSSTLIVKITTDSVKSRKSGPVVGVTFAEIAESTEMDSQSNSKVDSKAEIQTVTVVNEQEQNKSVPANAAVEKERNGELVPKNSEKVLKSQFQIDSGHINTSYETDLSHGQSENIETDIDSNATESNGTNKNDENSPKISTKLNTPAKQYGSMSIRL